MEGWWAEGHKKVCCRDGRLVEGLMACCRDGRPAEGQKESFAAGMEGPLKDRRKALLQGLKTG